MSNTLPEAMNKVFYRMDLQATEEGLAIITRKFFSVKETDCIHYVISDWDFHMTNVVLRNEGETHFEASKRKGYRIKRIHKGCSRIAFETEEKAFENLKYRKRRQVMHLRRELAFAEKFHEISEAKPLAEFWSDGCQRIIPETQEIVFEHLRFD